MPLKRRLGLIGVIKVAISRWDYQSYPPNDELRENSEALRILREEVERLRREQGLRDVAMAPAKWTEKGNEGLPYLGKRLPWETKEKILEKMLVPEPKKKKTRKELLEVDFNESK